jgi:hypothetical protein
MKKNAVALLLIAAVILYRLCAGFQTVHLLWLQNFAPVAAIALCSGIYLPRHLTFLVPLCALFISDLFLNWHYGYPLVTVEMASRYIAVAATVALGFTLRHRPRLLTVLPVSLLGSFIFYILTNSSSWLASPGYAHTFSGWLQALTTGLPGYPPTWMFFRATLISDLLFTTLFVLCMSATTSPAEDLSWTATPRPSSVK